MTDPIVIFPAPCIGRGPGVTSGTCRFPDVPRRTPKPEDPVGMGKKYETISSELASFIMKQRIFFVATAPLAADGHVNLSPKGLDTFRVLGPNRVAYLDLTGSGNETAAHLHENGRITFMFCAFDGPPRIVRLHGTGRLVPADSQEWAAVGAHFSERPGIRQFIVAEVSRVSTSCGFGVPLMDHVGERDDLIRWAEKKGDDLPAYRAEKNAVSIDGLPAPIP